MSMMSMSMGSCRAGHAEPTTSKDERPHGQNGNGLGHEPPPSESRSSRGASATARARRGVTLVEVLIVVAIIAILAAVALPNFLEAQTRSKVSRVRADMRTARPTPWVQTPAARPKSTSLAMRTASSSSSKGITARIGPKTSSCAMRMSFLTSVKMVGSMNWLPRAPSPV